MFILLSISTLGSAAVITVADNGSADYNTIQDAINAAEIGDIIEVAPGRYFENVDFHGKAITVTSTNPQDFNIVSTTIIDANRKDIAVSFHTDEDPNSIIDGFTITNGQAKYGAGICCWKGCSPTIKNCIIKDNESGSFVGFRGGAGIYCLDYSSPNIIKCTISSNTTYSGGGGICCINNSNPIIDDCVLSNNTATLRGGGIYSENNSNPTLINSTIISNTAQYGGGVCCYKNSSECVTGKVEVKMIPVFLSITAATPTTTLLQATVAGSTAKPTPPPPSATVSSAAITPIGRGAVYNVIPIRV